MDPAEEIVRSRLYFRCSLYPDYYFVDLESESGAYSGVAPQAEESCPEVHYYVEAVTRDFASVRTQERIAEVTSPSECSRRGLPGIYPGNDPRIVLGSTVAGPQLAPGFKGLGIASFLSASGAVVAAGGAGGVSTVVIAGVAAGGAAAAGVGALAASGDSGGTTASVPTGGASITAPPAAPPPPPPTPPVSTPPTEDVDACFTLDVPAPEIEVGEVVTIDGRCSTGGAGLFYRYDLGDGRVKEGQPFITVTWPVPGVYTLTLTVTRNGTSFGSGRSLVDEDTFSETIIVKAPATAPPPEPPPSEPPPNPMANLELLSSATPSNVESFESFTWELKVTNLGPDASNDVFLLDQLPPGPSFDVGGQPVQCNFSGSAASGYSVNCPIGNLGASDSRTFQFDMIAPDVQSSQVFENNASVTTTTDDPNLRTPPLEGLYQRCLC